MRLFKINLLILLVVSLLLPVNIKAIGDESCATRSGCVFTPSLNCQEENGVIKVTPVGGEGNCHNIQEAVDLVSTDQRVVIKIAEGVYDLAGLQVVDKVVNLNGAGKGKTVINLSNQFLIKNTKLLSRENLLKNFIEVRDLTIRGQGENEAIKVIDAIVYFNNLEIFTSINNNSGFAALRISQEKEFNYPATNIIVANSEIKTNYFAIKTNLLDRTFALRLTGSQVDRVMFNGPQDGTPENVDTLGMFWALGNRIKGLETFATDVTLEKNIIGETQGGMSAFSAHKSTGFLKNNTFISADYGVSLGCDRRFKLTNNIIAFNRRVGVNIIKGPWYTCDGDGFINGFGLYFNDVWGNNPDYGVNTGNPPLIDNQTGVNGNISLDPLFGEGFCLMSGSPLLGKGEGGEDIGAKGLCTTVPQVCALCTDGDSKSKGDADCDGKINFADFLIWRSELIKESADEIKGDSWRADFNCDGFVRVDDFLIWLRNFFWF